MSVMQAIKSDNHPLQVTLKTLLQLGWGWMCPEIVQSRHAGASHTQGSCVEGSCS